MILYFTVVIIEIVLYCFKDIKHFFISHEALLFIYIFFHIYMKLSFDYRLQLNRIALYCSVLILNSINFSKKNPEPSFRKFGTIVFFGKQLNLLPIFARQFFDKFAHHQNQFLISKLLHSILQTNTFD